MSSYAARDLSGKYFVQVALFYYQPTSFKILAATGIDGTRVRSNAPVVTFIDDDTVNKWSAAQLRRQWKLSLYDPELLSPTLTFKRDPYIPGQDKILPGDYSIELPIPKRFAEDAVYSDLFLRSQNGPSFKEVLRTQVPFQHLRSMLNNLASNLIVPLWGVRIQSVLKPDANGYYEPS